MKPSRLLHIIACLAIFCVLFSSACSALEQDEARATPIWSNLTPYRGSSVMVEIFFISDYSEELTIYRIGLHFDWMTSDTFAGLDISDDPVTVPSLGSHTFPPINIIIPQSVDVGAHSYFVGVDGIQGESTTFSWDSPNRTLQIQDPEEEVDNGDTSVTCQQDLLLIIGGVAVVVGVVVLIAIFIFRRKRKQTAPANQLTET